MRAGVRAARWAFGTALILLLAAAGGVVASGGAALLGGARPLAAARPGRTTRHALALGGRTRRYLLHLPPAARAGPVPLVLAFHGDGANAGVLRRSAGLDAAADRAGVAVAYPDGSGALGWLALSWHADRDCCGWARAHGVDDVAFAAALVRALARVPAIDTSRVAAVGFSAGGTLALRLACDRADLVRAVADVAGTMPHARCAPSRPVAVLLVQGADDDELGGEQRALRARGAPRRTHSLEDALRFWAAHAGCAAGAVARRESPGGATERAVGCPAGRAVALRTVAGHPHAWPGGRRPWVLAPRPAPQVDGAALVLGFVTAAMHAAAPSGHS